MLRPAGVLALAALSAACAGGLATDAECTAMLDRYLDMTIAGAPDLTNLSPAAAERTRQERKVAQKAAEGYVRSHAQCASEVSRREWRCAMKTFTLEAWQACID